jgi:hypothetical protein
MAISPYGGATASLKPGRWARVLARIHEALAPVLPRAEAGPSAETTGETMAQIVQLLSLIEGRSDPGEDEAKALRWITG